MKYIKTFDVEVYPQRTETTSPILQCDITSGEVTYIDEEYLSKVELVDSEQVHESDYYETILKIFLEDDSVKCNFIDEGFHATIPGVIDFTCILTPKSAIIALYGYNQESKFNYVDFFNKIVPSGHKVVITAIIPERN